MNISELLCAPSDNCDVASTTHRVFVLNVVPAPERDDLVRADDAVASKMNISALLCEPGSLEKVMAKPSQVNADLQSRPPSPRHSSTHQHVQRPRKRRCVTRSSSRSGQQASGKHRERRSRGEGARSWNPALNGLHQRLAELQKQQNGHRAVQILG